MSFKLIAAAGAIALLAGCAPVDPGLGEAVKYNALAQTVDPDPIYRPDGALPGASGDTAAAALDRYRKGTVKQPVSQTTTTSVSGGGK